MSRILINQYYTNLSRAKQFGKSTNEQSIRNYFWNLLNEYARKQNYEVVTEVTCQGTIGKKVRPDGIVKNLFGLDIGLWESKDEKDSINDEIDTKHKKGYPFYNILFEDSNEAVLFQRGEEVMRGSVLNPDELHKIITAFIGFKSDVVYKFEDALQKFKADIPAIVETLRKRIELTRVKNKNFIAVSNTFLELCKVEINPDITEADIREMMIQHILTSDIFNKIFDDPEFHRHNNIARELEKLIEILFTYSERKNLMGNIEHYYDAINSAASGITDHHEKQKFLKVLYENFYKVYNPKAADRLGVVYTPNEIVKFMIESTEYLLHKHFGKTLADKNVEILDPATGTGTFITSIIDHLPPQDLVYKYKNEIHANEVAILPYYIANLNIEFTFKQKMKYYEEFKNLCFVDTLDNTNALLYSGKQENMFGLSSENSERIKRQNSKKISVVIGNPPYNANQANFNEFNKNRSYYLIDKRIKETFVKYSKASNKANLYDMYTRFYRWAMDRIDKNGVICLITNNSFINNKAFDGFRKTIKDEFDFAYIIDLGGNIRELSGKDGIWLNEEHTIFGVAAAVGIAIMFLVKKVTQDNSFCKINYIHPNDIRATRDEKLDWLRTSPFEQILFENITPKNDSWIKQSNNDFDDLIPLAKDRNSIFSLYSLGVNSNRDEWIYDFERKNLSKKMKYFISVYNILITNDEKKLSPLIKWSSSLENYFHRKIKGSFSEDYIKISCFRPFVKKYHYQEKIFNHRLTQNHYDSFGINLDKPNSLICINVNGKDIYNLASDMIVDLHFTGDCQYFPLSQYDSNGNRIDNITDWGLEQFVKHYGVVIASPERTKQSTKQKQIASGRNLRNDEQQITKEDIFHYVYAVLHNPAYRKKYELNLKREFPRIPLYKDFWQWAKWGKQLMDIHINYEDAKLYPLKVIASEVKQSNKEQIASGKNLRNDNGKKPEENNEHQPKIKVKLRADKTAGTIEIDELTLIKDVPKEAWEYKLGNRSAIEWILDQYKEKKPSDPTIAEKFNTYKFAEYKDHVIELIKKVTTVSVETIKIIKEMESAKN